MSPVWLPQSPILSDKRYMESTPLFSIITVCYNAASTVGRTIDSVADQTFTDYEHIVIDGASTDNTLDIINSVPGAARRHVVSEPDHGIYDAMNKGIGLASGTYLIFMNAGDKFHTRDTLEKIAIAADAGEMPGVIYGQTWLVDIAGAFVAPRHLTAPPALSYTDFARGMLVCHQAFVALRRIAPLYNTSYRYSADYEWCLRCLQHSRKNVFIDDILVDYLHEGLTTAHRRASLMERFRIMSYYYGFWSTLRRHFGFALRFARNRFTKKPS